MGNRDSRDFLGRGEVVWQGSPRIRHCRATWQEQGGYRPSIQVYRWNDLEMHFCISQAQKSACLWRRKGRSSVNCHPPTA